jgi:hypothetical protein
MRESAVADKDAKAKAWQKRLEDNFNEDGVVGGKLLARTMEAEERIGLSFAEKWHGHRILTDSFVGFFAETLDEQAGFSQQHGWPQDEPYYVTCLMMYLTMYRAVRAAEILSMQGYPFSGYALLRSVKDQAWILCAAANKMSTFPTLLGWEGLPKGTWTGAEHKQIVANRMDVERENRFKILGKHSGLTQSSQVLLTQWEQMFNWEAHRGLYTLFQASAKLYEKQEITFVAEPDEANDVMYVNRSNETNWMILRLLPYMRRADTPDNAEWTRKWKVLDESFRQMLESLSSLGKKIGDAFIEMMDTKFKFDPSFHYFDPGKGGK